MKQEHVIAAFNRGRVSRYGVARLEVKRIALAAETQTNYIPRVLGSMSLRPGMQYLGSTASNNPARMIPFIYATDDTALLEFTDSLMRVWVSDALVTRPTVTSAVTNGNPFIIALAGWTDSDEGSAASTFVSPYMQLVGDGTSAAIRDQVVTVPAASIGVTHALRIVIARGPVYLRVGTAAGDDSYVNETALRRGTHSIAFTPTGDFNIRFFSRSIPVAWVQSCAVEAAGTFTIPTPYTSSTMRATLRADQSGDITFVACDGIEQTMIERRANNSWSVVYFEPEDGPFDVINITPITLTASATTGNITVTASKALFYSTDVATLYQIISDGQSVTKSIAAQNTFTNDILITGVGSDRTFTIVITGLTATLSTVTLQRSLGVTGSWVDVSGKTWTTDTTETYADALDNQLAYYRIGVKAGGYVAGTIVCTMSIATGSITGVVRVTAFTSSTVVSAEVLSELGGTNATALWKPGEWSPRKGYPTAVCLHEGRLWWSGHSKVWGSISDSYLSYDPDITGDSGLISRTLAAGPIDTISWMASNQRLLIGSQSIEFSARASTLDEPLSPTAFVVKPASNQGSGNVDVVKIDNRCVFVQRNGSRVYELAFDARNYDYSANDLTAVIPEIGYPGIVRMAMQRQIDTRIHCVRSDGTVALNIQDKTEDMKAWVDITTDGLIEDAVVLPAGSGYLDDYVYYVVKRTINGSTVRFLEKWAQSTECIGGTINKQADAFKLVTNSGPSTIVSGLSHLEGESVVVWADGADVGTDADYGQTYTVSGGQITLATAATSIVVGLPYTAQFKSMKLGSPSQNFTNVLNHYKNIRHIGMVLADTHPRGVRYGVDFTYLDSMPLMEHGKPVDTDAIWTEYDEVKFELDGIFDPNARLCLQSQAPMPATILSTVLFLELS